MRVCDGGARLEGVDGVNAVHSLGRRAPRGTSDELRHELRDARRAPLHHRQVELVFRVAVFGGGELAANAVPVLEGHPEQFRNRFGHTHTDHILGDDRFPLRFLGDDRFLRFLGGEAKRRFGVMFRGDARWIPKTW